MKTRKFFALFLSAVLLMALAIVPANAANDPNYTVNHTFASATDIGDLAPEGGVTVEGNVAKIAANKYMLKSFTANTYNAMELKMAVTAGSATVRLGGTTTSGFLVKVTATDYTIYTDNPNAGAYVRTFASGTHTGEVVFSYALDKVNNEIIFTVNGTEKVLPAVVTDGSAPPYVGASQLDKCFTNWAGFGIFTDGTGNASVSYIKLGTVNFANQSYNEVIGNTTYTVNQTFATDLGDLATEGGVTVSGNAAVISAGKHVVKAFAANAYNAMELKMKVTAGSATIRMGKYSSSCFQVKVTATDYTIYTDNPAGGAFQRTLATGTHTGEVVISYKLDKVNNRAIFNVNGTEKVLSAVVTEPDATPLVLAGNLDNSFTNWAGFGIFADASGSASLSYIKLGTAEYTSAGGGNNGGGNNGGGAADTGDGLFAVVASIAVLAGAAVASKKFIKK